MTPEEEDQLKIKVLAQLEKGRPGWDIPHTLACVHWMKELIKHETGNPRILLPAIYMHDIGYPQKHVNYDPEKTLDWKKYHMKEGAKISREILSQLGGYTTQEINEIAAIIEMHDELDQIEKGTTEHEQLVFEADSLGQIDSDRVPPNFSKEERAHFLTRFKNKRATMFRTPTGKRYLNQLLSQEQL